MEYTLEQARAILLGYLNGDEEKLAHYLHLLSTCRKAFEVSDRVIKVLYLNEHLSDEAVTKGAFYAPIARLAKGSGGKSIHPKTLYYHIVSNHPQWKKEREQLMEEATETSYVDTRIIYHPEGGYDVCIHIHDKKISEEMLELFKSYIRLGYIRERQKLVKKFNARGESSCWEFATTSLLLGDLLTMMKERFGSITLTYKSRFTTQELITIDEAIALVTEELAYE